MMAGVTCEDLLVLRKTLVLTTLMCLPISCLTFDMLWTWHGGKQQYKTAATTWAVLSNKAKQKENMCTVINQPVRQSADKSRAT